MPKRTFKQYKLTLCNTNGVRKNKRGKQNSAKSVMTNIVFVGFNPDGAKSKLTTIKKLIRDTKATVVTMQETKCQQTGQVNFDEKDHEHLIPLYPTGGGGPFPRNLNVYLTLVISLSMAIAQKLLPLRVSIAMTSL